MRIIVVVVKIWACANTGTHVGVHKHWLVHTALSEWQHGWVPPRVGTQAQKRFVRPSEYSGICLDFCVHNALCRHWCGLQWHLYGFQCVSFVLRSLRPQGFSMYFVHFTHPTHKDLVCICAHKNSVRIVHISFTSHKKL